MLKIKILFNIFFGLLFLNSHLVEASFYSTQDNSEFSYSTLVSQFNLVILTSKDCAACRQLQSNLQKCNLPNNFKIAWVGSQVHRYEFHKANFKRIKTSEKIIQKLTSITPKSILNSHEFRKGVFNCLELERAI